MAKFSTDVLSYYQGLEFDAVAPSRVDVSHINDYNLQGNFTIETKVKLLSGDNAYCLWKRGNNNNGWWFGIDSTGLVFTTFGRTIYNTPMTNKSEWNHISVVFDGQLVKLFINGIEEYSSSFSGLGTTTRGFRMAARSNNNGGIDGYSNHIQDETRLWNVARTQQEIQLNMNKELTGNEEGLIA
ncbi:MAG TPA: LamG domain-containing protein, partial [Tissierellaceae bacterium]|nr:LamG domain-containing protein [Tissierellaceae bacterium]